MSSGILKSRSAHGVSREWHRLARSAGYKATNLAALSGVSLRTLQRHFKTHYGVTVSDWLKSVRMQEAVTRVRAGDRIKEVAMDLGYKQLSHFSREFKRKYGAPPTRLNLRHAAVPEKENQHAN